MDCRTARSLLDFARPGCVELQPDDADALERHLSGCPECDALFRQERALDAHIGRAVRDVPVPRDLRDRVMQRLARDRRAWLRSQAARAGSLTAAAAVLLVLGLAGWSKWVQPPLAVVNLEELPHYIAAQPTTPDGMEEWFQNHYGRAISAPRELNGMRLNYELLTFWGMNDLQGRQTPILLFDRCDGKRARIYVLSADRFNIDPNILPRGLQTSSRGVRIEVFDAPDPKFAYLVIYPDSEGLKPFLLDGGVGRL
jgi:hypothetical protein